MKRHILIAILGLLCAFIDINYIGFLIALNLIVVLVCAAFPFMKKNYIFFLLLVVNLALYLNNIYTPFEKPELWTYKHTCAGKCSEIYRTHGVVLNLAKCLSF